MNDSQTEIVQPIKPKCEHCINPMYCELNGKCQKGLEREA